VEYPHELCGWVGNGADIGGFTGAAVTPELLVRWVQLGIYFARFSIHSSSWKESVGGEADGETGYNLGCTNEPWMFPEMEDTIRALLVQRCALRPLLLSLHLEAFLNNYPVTRPLVFHFMDDLNSRTQTESFEFLLGESLLVAPVLDEGHTTREVYFPGNNGTIVESWCDIVTGVWYPGGSTAVVDAPLKGRLPYGAPLFLRSRSGFVLDSGVAEAGSPTTIRTVYLASDPLHHDDVVFDLLWREDATHNQSGVIKSEDDMIIFQVRAKASGKSIFIEHVAVSKPSQTTISEVKLKLLPKDSRTLRTNVDLPHPFII